MDQDPPDQPRDDGSKDDTEQEMADADRANGERPPDDPRGTNDTEARYGKDESPA
jgi:hypothetical protein